MLYLGFFGLPVTLISALALCSLAGTTFRCQHIHFGQRQLQNIVSRYIISKISNVSSIICRHIISDVYAPRESDLLEGIQIDF